MTDVFLLTVFVHWANVRNAASHSDVALDYFLKLTILLVSISKSVKRSIIVSEMTKSLGGHYRALGKRCNETNLEQQLSVPYVVYRAFQCL